MIEGGMRKLFLLVGVAVLSLGGVATAPSQEGRDVGASMPSLIERPLDELESNVVPSEEAVERVLDEVRETALGGAEQVVATVDEREQSLRDELYARVEQTRMDIEQVMMHTQATTGLSDNQIYGITIGLVAGAVLADFLGGGGLVTISLSAGGAALGNFVAGQIDENKNVIGID